MVRKFAAAAALLAMAAGCSQTETAPARRKVGPGERVPDVALVGEDGKATTLGALIPGEGFAAVVFHHPDCPCSANCGHLVNELAASGASDFRAIGILAADADDARVRDALALQRRDGAIAFPVLLDADRSAVRAFGATHTPEVWLVDARGVVHFHGAPENTLFPGTPGHRRLLADALESLRAGREPSPAAWEPIGCEIPE